jgi:pyridoxamine 5'-phosphate oxidase
VDLSDLDADPHAQFDRWFAEAAAAGVRNPEQMALATATRDAMPSVRMVLLKGHDARGFVFYTNHSSRKAAELEANPRAAAAFHWEPQGRQVRVEGTVERIPDDESFAYFRTRPRDSQISAWASPQSRSIASRAELEQRVDEIEQQFAGHDEVPLPPFWGGYGIVAAAIEFWQGQPSRLHDRLRYELTDGVWTGERLAP